MKNFTRQTPVPVSAADLYAWHARKGAFERLAPPWDDIDVVSSDHSIEDGARLIMRINKGPTHVTWEALHKDHIPGEQFVDVQVRGPFATWEHTHRFEADGANSVLVDSVQYELPLAPLSSIAQGYSEDVLQRMFDFRHQRTINDLKRHALYKDKKPMKIAITGASGLIGTALSAFLTTGGHSVFPMVRGKAGQDQISWDIKNQKLDIDALEGLDAVVHLAGESISGLWTNEKKRRILESRTDGTALLAKSFKRMTNPPKSFISTSAIGYYGNRGDAALDETSSAGNGFLADVCVAWEEAAKPAEEAGVRLVHPRIGIVLSPQGGALKQLLTPFKLGAGGVVGDGRQYMSWITLDDIVGAFLHVLQHDELRGPVNFTAPNPAQNRDFTKTLARVLNRPSIVPLPAAAVKLTMGEMGQALLLDGARVLPDKLQRSGFEFLHPTLELALKAELGL